MQKAHTISTNDIVNFSKALYNPISRVLKLRANEKLRLNRGSVFSG